MHVGDRLGIMEGRPAPRVLAVASSGGHWVQLMRLRPAWQGCDVAYLTTDASYLAPLRAQAERDGVPPPRFYTTVAANRWQKLRLLSQLASIAWVVVRERPTVVCTTGAAPGYFAIRIAGLLGARTVWIDQHRQCGKPVDGRVAGRQIRRHLVDPVGKPCWQRHR
jgi:hypothetical protein